MTWWEHAVCRNIDPDVFFPDERAGGGNPANRNDPWADARAACSACPVQQRCLNEALAAETTVDRTGMFGGKSPDERQLIARGTPATGRDTCGTESGYQWHRRHGQVPCADCIRGRSAANVARKRRRRELLAEVA